MRAVFIVNSWSLHQFNKYLASRARCVLIPKSAAPERPLEDDRILMYSLGGAEATFRITSMAREIEVQRHPSGEAISTRGLHKGKGYLIRRTGYGAGQVRFVREAPTDLLPLGEWRSFWLAEVQYLPPMPEAPKPEAEPPIPPVPAKRGRGRPRKENPK